MAQMVSNLEIVSQINLFRDLSPTELADIVPRFEEDDFDEDTYVFFEGDAAQRFWVVKQGQVKIIKHGEAGKESVIEVIQPGEVFGGTALFMAQNPATAQALSDLTTLSLSVEDYEALIHEYPGVALRVIKILSQRLLSVIGTRVVAGETVERRIAHVLLKLADKCAQETEEGLTLTISLTRQDIADLADTTMESAIRVMSKLRKAGVVRTLSGGYIVITDTPGLRGIAGQLD